MSDLLTSAWFWLGIGLASATTAVLAALRLDRRVRRLEAVRREKARRWDEEGL